VGKVHKTRHVRTVKVGVFKTLVICQQKFCWSLEFKCCVYNLLFSTCLHFTNVMRACVDEPMLLSVVRQKKLPIICQFEAPVSDRTHSKPEVSNES